MTITPPGTGPVIPRILHQTWKSDDIPDIPVAWRAFQQSWRTHNPAWEVMFWTDATARTFIATEYSWFLETYDAYPAPVMRADALRYFLLAHYGGVYADMDYECLRPLDEILQGRELILVREPGEHARIAEVRESGLEWLLCNALMASVPGHAFWQHVVERLKDAHGNGTPLSATGPIFLTRAWESFGGRPAHVLDAELLCPMTQTESRMGRWSDPAFREVVARRAWAVHHWSNTWVPDTPAPSPFGPLDLLPIHLLVNRRIVMSEELRRDVPGAVTPSPRISCLMVTRGRTEKAMGAVRCFRKQTWRNRELVVVDDGGDPTLEDEIGLLGDRDIRFIRLAPGNMPLGALRNLAAGLASGEYVAQWDDDDLSHPRRLELQMAAICTMEADASFLLRELIWWPRERRLAISRRRVWESTILCRRDLLPAYPHERRGEDTAVTARLMGERRLALVDAPQLYLYIRHGANTFDEEHFARQWSMADARFEGADYAATLRSLGEAFPFGDYPDGTALSEA